MNNLYESINSLYGGKDPREIPAYSINDAARYLRIPSSTIRAWTAGYHYRIKDKQKFFQPLISISQKTPLILSFTNLVEIHVLRAIRQHHQIQMDKIREALDFVELQFKISHPLARESFRTDGVNLFIERYGSVIKASKSGQKELKQSLNAHLERIEADDSGLAIRLYPFTRSCEANNPCFVVIDPRIAFGRLVITNTGIATSIIKERYWAGDSIDSLAADYRCDRLMIEEAIRCELSAVA